MYATKARWSAPKLIAAASQAVPEAHVRALRVLAHAPAKSSATTAVATPAAPALPAVPVERRPPPDGYLRAIEAHRQAARPVEQARLQWRRQVDASHAAALRRARAERAAGEA
ncbi:hypothetical protein [Streptomyces sp. NPDC048659]|uniref:hypothetical protein n=1 Tax=Streptomyces sp. NPDC048659 TaxID=3155489 RepID=UPI003427FADF